jgi:hypothetical protein
VGLVALRRARADEYAVRVNRAVALLVDLSAADAVRGLQSEFGLSERQGRRYVNEALARPEGVVVPERTVVFTVRLALSLIAGLRERALASGVSLGAATAAAVEAYLEQAGGCPGGQAR